MKYRKNLNGSALLNNLRKQFYSFEDQRTNPTISITDIIMSGLAIFKLKFPSLLQFDKQRRNEVKKHNLKSLFGLKNIPSDTQLRAVIDEVPYQNFLPVFKNLFELLRREKVLQNFTYHIPGSGDFLLNPIDGTGIFSSTKIKCPHCLVKEMKKSLDKVEDDDVKLMFYHQLLGSGIVHPDNSCVIPMAPEPIMTQTGESKNDSEINAAKRYFYRLKDEHPKTNFLIGADALHSNVPELSLIRSLGWSFITSLKTGSHKFLFNEIKSKEFKEVIVEDFIGDKIKKKRVRIYKFINNIQLIKSNDFKINFLDFEEVITWENKKGEQKKKVHFSWATNLEINNDNLFEIMRAGRARWKDENEIFNTLKNHGYNLEHNYGHGKKNLSTNFAMLANLAFLIDQIEELTCQLYRKARDEARTKYSLWEQVRTLIQYFKFERWNDLLELIALNKKAELIDTS